MSSCLAAKLCFPRKKKPRRAYLIRRCLSAAQTANYYVERARMLKSVRYMNATSNATSIRRPVTSTLEYYMKGEERISHVVHPVRQAIAQNTRTAQYTAILQVLHSRA